jgi:hypothetical protein
VAVRDHEGVDDVAQAYRAAAVWIELYLNTDRDKSGQLSSWFIGRAAFCWRSR